MKNFISRVGKKIPRIMAIGSLFGILICSLIPFTKAEAKYRMPNSEDFPYAGATILFSKIDTLSLEEEQKSLRTAPDPDSDMERCSIENNVDSELLLIYDGTMEVIEKYNVPQKDHTMKSYEPYKAIHDKTSNHYLLQRQFAYTDEVGFRKVGERYCVAIGSYFDVAIGQYFDLILENGTIIPCIKADEKDDAHTDWRNLYTSANNCCSEFLIDTKVLAKEYQELGDVSWVFDDWKSPVVEVIVYDAFIMELADYEKTE